MQIMMMMIMKVVRRASFSFFSAAWMNPAAALARVLFAQENRRHDRLNPLIIFQVAKMRCC